MTWLLFIFIAFLAIWSLTSRSADRIASLMIAIALILAAGLRKDGWDFGEHLRMIENVRSTALDNADYALRINVAKDPMLIWVTDFVSPLFGYETWPVFMAFSVLAVIPKYIAALTLPRFSALFLAIYFIFISPTQEFSGIRSAVGIGILLLCLAYKMRFFLMIPLLGVAMSAHIMMIFSTPIILFFSPLFRRWIIVALTFLVALSSFFFADILNEFQRGLPYIGRRGTIFAFFMPIISLSLFFILLYRDNSLNDTIKKKINLIIAISMGISLGLTQPSVGVAWRILEAGICLLLFMIIRSLAYCRSERDKIFAILILIAFIVFESFHHLYSGNWTAIKIL